MDLDIIGDVTVVDVYESAAGIGREFERIIDNYGTECITNLMPQVIKVLETLEVLAQRNEREAAQITDLQLAVQKLEAQQHEKTSARMKFETEIEQIEDSWRSETKELVQTIERLQDENRRLHSKVTTKEGDDGDSDTIVLSDQDWNMITNLRDMLEREREQLRKAQEDTEQKSQNVEALEAQVDRLTQVCSELRRKSKIIQTQGRILVEEKADLQGQLQEKEQKIARMKEKLGLDDKEGSPDLDGKIVVDTKSQDPDIPRFTLNELREILWERNELKGKVMELEEELEHYKPNPHVLTEDMYEGDVQGPINREPDEKLYPSRYQKSGIKRFFRIILGDESPFGAPHTSPSHKAMPV